MTQLNLFESSKAVEPTKPLVENHYDIKTGMTFISIGKAQKRYTVIKCNGIKAEVKSGDGSSWKITTDRLIKISEDWGEAV